MSYSNINLKGYWYVLCVGIIECINKTSNLKRSRDQSEARNKLWMAYEYYIDKFGMKYVIYKSIFYMTTDSIDGFKYKAWHFITSFIDLMIQIYVGQKVTKNQWRVMVLQIVLHTTLLYRATNTRNTNVLAVFKQYLVLVQKE